MSGIFGFRSATYIRVHLQFSLVSDTLLLGPGLRGVTGIDLSGTNLVSKLGSSPFINWNFAGSAFFCCSSSSLST